MGIEIRLTGLTTLRGHDGVERHLERRQARVAFVRLVADRASGTSRDELAETVWPGRLPESWGSVLRTVVSLVRAFVDEGLGDRGNAIDPVTFRSGRYWLQLPDDVLVDVESAATAIAAAEEALRTGDLGEAHELAVHGAALLRAPVLPDHDSEWACSTRERLAELLLTGLETASSAALGRGDAVSALRLANEAVGLAPLRESAHRLRMTAHASTGNRAEALRAYHRLRRTLMEELGIDPSSETEAVYLDLLEPPLPSEGTSHHRSTRLTVTDPGGGRVPFVGRENALSAIADAWTAAAARDPRAILISGEAGIGKTRLALEAGRRAANEGGLLLYGRCDREPVVPYQPVVEVLDAYVAAVASDGLPDLRPGSCAALAAVLPSFPCPHERRHDELWDRLWLFDAITRLLVRAASDKTVFVVLDDMQWADEGTLLLVRHLLRRIRGTRLLMTAITRRPIRSPHPLTDVDRALDSEGKLLRLPLGGLDETEIVQLLAQQRQAPESPVEARAARLLEATAGNPLMILELVGHGWTGEAECAPVPPRIDDLVTDRLDDLTAATRELLNAAAVAGTEFDLDAVGTFTNLDVTGLLDALDEAVGHELLAPRGPRRFRFVHPIVREALLARLSEPRLAFLSGQGASNSGH